jgi:glycosyltransferase involved in cell wall biosynthesis
MDLCYVVSNDLGGGVFNAALDACRAAADHGHKATLLTLARRTRPLQEFHGVTIASLEVESLINPNNRDIPERFYRWVVGARPGVVLFGNVPAAEEAIPFIPADIRCVLTIHNAAKQFWRNALRFEQDVNSIITVSQYVANQFQKKLRDPQKVVPILNGGSFTEVVSSANDRADDIFFIGSAGGLKGDADLPKLWPLLLERGFRGRLHWIGAYEPRAARALRKQHGIDQIIWHGRIQREQVYAIAKRCKVYLALCRSDACPMAVIESASMGALVITWDIETGITELVKNGTNGFFVPYFDLERMADTVISAINNYHQFGEEAIRYSRQTYSLERMWMKYEEHLNHLLSIPPLPRSHDGEPVSSYRARRQYFIMLPRWIRRPLVSFIRNSPRLDMLTRHWRGI